MLKKLIKIIDAKLRHFKKYDVILRHKLNKLILMKLEIFEPSLCCPSGVCGPEPEKELIELQNLIQLLDKAGIKVDRYAINQAPTEFAKNPVIKDFMRSGGTSKLPVTLLDGKIIKQEAYPGFEELTQYFPQLKDVNNDSKILGIFS